MKLHKRNNNYILTSIKLPVADEMALDNGEALEVELKVIDSRIISKEQRNLIFALCGEIADYTGQYDKDYWRLVMQQYNANLREIETESLSNCSVTYARKLTETIVNFCIEKEIPIAREILEKGKYQFSDNSVYAMCLKRICVVCGARADIHHVDSVGMGHNRNKITHVGKKIMPICRVHHNEIHNIGNEKFIEKYHVSPIVADEKMDYFIRKGKLKVTE